MCGFEFLYVMIVVGYWHGNVIIYAETAIAGKQWNNMKQPQAYIHL